jgi:hypothetical protein
MDENELIKVNKIEFDYSELSNKFYGYKIKKAQKKSFAIIITNIILPISP